ETGEKRQCEYCNKQVIAITYCESCIRNYLEKQDGIFSSVYIATWKNGPFKEWDAEKHELRRGDDDTYILKNNELALDIINGVRPKVIDGTPPDYANLMVKCWDAHPKNRPDAKTIMKKMESLLKEIYENDGVYEELKLIPIKISKKKTLINLIKSKLKCKKNKRLSSEIKNTFLTTEKNKSTSFVMVEKDKSQFSTTEQDESLLLVTVQYKSRIYEFQHSQEPKNAS
ncbi:6711_t:CDS:2, partial [Racocetra fulgida]